MITTARRYSLLKMLAYEALDEQGLASVYRGQWQAEDSTPLPADFPARTKLVAASYVALEDVDGASPTELMRLGLSSHEADAVRSALDALL